MASARELRLWEGYSRLEAHDIFAPGTPFSPQAGTWGLQGIVRLQDAPGDYVFFVTFGKRQGAHEFDEAISEDGVLTWQSQPRQDLDDPWIKDFISHDDRINSIHLFLRTRRDRPYTYYGPIGYLDHDAAREYPVYFTWQILNWPPPPGVLATLGLALAAPTDPISPADLTPDTLTKTPPPSLGPSRRRSSLLGTHAVLPGQDARNRKLGAAGERLVLRYERERLAAAGRVDLADQIVHVAVVEGDSAGYDIRSFNVDGTDRHLEVKTTRGPATNAFYITPNEVAFSSAHPDSYVLMRLYAYTEETNTANFYDHHGPIGSAFDLQPTEFRARLSSSSRHSS